MAIDTAQELKMSRKRGRYRGTALFHPQIILKGNRRAKIHKCNLRTFLFCPYLYSQIIYVRSKVNGQMISLSAKLSKLRNLTHFQSKMIKICQIIKKYINKNNRKLIQASSRLTEKNGRPNDFHCSRTTFLVNRACREIDRLKQLLVEHEQAIDCPNKETLDQMSSSP